VSGSMIRRIGRRCNDASPVITVRNGCAAAIPDSSRMVVPELTASTGDEAAQRPPSPRPVITTVAGALRRIVTPRARRHSSVAAQSAPGEYPLITDSPSAIAPSRAYRCEIDLSPGTRTRPAARDAGAMVIVSAGVRSMSRTIAFALVMGSGLVCIHSRACRVRRVHPFLFVPGTPAQARAHRMLKRGGTVRLQIPSNFDMVDFVQVVSDRVGQLAGMDEDTVHWIGVAVRESVINAIKHGNREDYGKLVTVEFTFTPIASPHELVVRVLDQGEGFEPDEVADPLAPENILKSSGRGIFFMRSFMDDVVLRRHADGGMEVRMVKKLATGA
jgi:serine/threonine-protein kinase RsbW